MKSSWSILSQIKHFKNINLHLRLELLQVNFNLGPYVSVTSVFHLYNFFLESLIHYTFIHYCEAEYIFNFYIPYFPSHLKVDSIQSFEQLECWSVTNENCYSSLIIHSASCKYLSRNSLTSLGSHLIHEYILMADSLHEYISNLKNLRRIYVLHIF